MELKLVILISETKNDHHRAYSPVVFFPISSIYPPENRIGPDWTENRSSPIMCVSRAFPNGIFAEKAYYAHSTSIRAPLKVKALIVRQFYVL